MKRKETNAPAERLKRQRKGRERKKRRWRPGHGGWVPQRAAHWRSELCVCVRASTSLGPTWGSIVLLPPPTRSRPSPSGRLTCGRRNGGVARQDPAFFCEDGDGIGGGPITHGRGTHRTAHLAALVLVRWLAAGIVYTCTLDTCACTLLPLVWM